MVIEVTEPRPSATAKNNEPEDKLVERVMFAIGQAAPSDILPLDTEDLLRQAISQIHADRSKVIAVAKSIARLDGSKTIQLNHIAEAIQYQAGVSARMFDNFAEIVA
jgi:predicted ATPase with chaperone activity